jgi:miniconductance mechanosensitive channel
VGPTLGLGPEELAAAALPIALTAALAQRVALAFIVVTAASAVSAFLDALNDIYTETYEQARSRPMKGYLQVVGLALYMAVGVVVVSILANRSPVVFLSGLSALTAVLLLVFRDTILSFVASLQIASNDMIRIGDWVEVPQANADGDVIDIALHTADGEIDRRSRYELLREYMGAKQEQLRAFRERKGEPTDDVIPEARRLTNVGTYRAYVFAYLKAHPMVHDEMTLLVQQLAPTSKGLPIELYCFSGSDLGRLAASAVSPSEAVAP